MLSLIPGGSRAVAPREAPEPAAAAEEPRSAQSQPVDDAPHGPSPPLMASDESQAEALAAEAQRLSRRAPASTAPQTRESPPVGRAPREVARHATYRPDALAPRRPTRPVAPSKRLVIVIDDVGYNLNELKAFLALPFPLTFAVLPGLPHSREAATRILAAGQELILHQPMEALGGQNPGPGAIRLRDSPEKAARILASNLDTLPGAKGFNNHMGSAVTRRADIMLALVALAKKRGIYYLDSLTAPDTATAQAAAKARIRYWERDVFLDNSPDRASILRAIDEGKKKAEQGGTAVMIGHVWSAELAQTLADLYPELIAEGFSLSTISRIMIEEADENSGN